MEDSQIAKNLLVNDNILRAITAEVHEYDLIVSENVRFPDNLDNHYRFKLKMSVEEGADELLRYLSKHGGAYFFTQWHIENQEMERESKNTGVWDGNIIYTREMIHFEFDSRSLDTGEKPILPKNPFEVDMQYYMPQTEIQYIQFDGIVTLNQPIAATIMPNLDVAYIVVSGRSR